jgi:NADH dehydrogenase
VSVLYNTYWVRFGQQSDAVGNTLAMFEAAKSAGVERIVHVSITNASKDSPLPYFRAKAAVERALVNSGVSYAILRPAVLFGEEDILINNIAWSLRRLPVFGIFGDGRYRLQPIYVDDLAKLAVEQGKKRENGVINAIGPETFTYRELIEKIGQAIGKKRPIVSVPPWFGYGASWVLGQMVGDVVVTKDEIAGLMANQLYVDAPPAGTTKLTEWIQSHAETLGSEYASELARRKDRRSAYR